MVAKRLILALVLSLAGTAIFTIWLSKKFAKPVASTGVELHYVAAVIVTPPVVDPVTDTAFPEEPKLPVPMLDYSKFDKSNPELKPKTKK